MDEVILGSIIKKFALFSGVVGILVGLDLLLGARVISVLKRLLDRSFNLDKVIIAISSVFRKILDKVVDFDGAIIKNRARIVLGILFVVVSAVMIFLSVLIH